MLQAKQKEVLYVRKELVFECPHCGMKYILYAVLGENEDRLNQEYVRYCPYCGFDGGKNDRYRNLPLLSRSFCEDERKVLIEEGKNENL